MSDEWDWGTADFEGIDLTHKMRNGMPVWPGHPEFQQEAVQSFERGDIACNHSLSLSEHSGTHFDAPMHFVPGGRTIDQIALDRYFGRMMTIDASDLEPDSGLSSGRIERFEAEHGPIVAHDAVMFRFGWDRFWDHPTEAVRFLSDWPGLTGEAADLLVERQVRLVATDCMSIDHYGSREFPAHRKLLGANILVGENFANLDKVPPTCCLAALPLFIEGGSGAPLRAVALVRRGD